jgi:hypothetical protein
MSAQKSDLASPTFTGTVTIPTAAVTTFTLGGVTVTSTAAELNLLDGVTATTAEINYLSGVTSGIQSQIDALGNGTVTSVDATVPTGFSISGNPITSSGTLAIGFTAGYSLPTDASQTNWNTAFGWGDHASAGYAPTASPTFTGTTVISGLTYPVADGTNGQVLTTNGTGTLSFTTVSAGGSGTVTSVDLSATATGLTASGGPVTGSGTLDIALTAGYVIPTTTDQSNWNTAFGWGNHASAGYLTSGSIGVSDLDSNDILTSAESFIDDNFHLLTAAATQDLIDTNVAGFGSGTVTSVAMTVPTGLAVTGTPITTSGTLALAMDTGYAIPTTANQTNWTTAYNKNTLSASFATGTGVITFTNRDATTFTVDIDGRYLQANSTVSIGAGWTVEQDVSNNLIFKYSGTSKMKLDTSGNLTVVGDVTAYGTV